MGVSALKSGGAMAPPGPPVSAAYDLVCGIIQYNVVHVSCTYIATSYTLDDFPTFMAQCALRMYGIIASYPRPPENHYHGHVHALSCRVRTIPVHLGDQLLLCGYDSSK